MQTCSWAASGVLLYVVVKALHSLAYVLQDGEGAESTRCVGWVSEYKCKHRNMEKKKKKRIYNLERYVFYSSSKQWNYSYLCHLHRRIKRINTIRSSVIKQLKRITVFDWVFISSSHESRNNQKKASENFIVCSNSKYS